MLHRDNFIISNHYYQEEHMELMEEIQKLQENKNEGEKR